MPSHEVRVRSSRFAVPWFCLMRPEQFASLDDVVVVLGRGQSSHPFKQKFVQLPVQLPNAGAVTDFSRKFAPITHGFQPQPRADNWPTTRLRRSSRFLSSVLCELVPQCMVGPLECLSPLAVLIPVELLTMTDSKVKLTLRLTFFSDANDLNFSMQVSVLAMEERQAWRTFDWRRKMNWVLIQMVANQILTSYTTCLSQNSSIGWCAGTMKWKQGTKRFSQWFSYAEDYV